mgnify:CR=1 FL=1
MEIYAAPSSGTLVNFFSVRSPVTSPSTVLRNIPQKKRGYGQTGLVLSELEDCISDNTSVEQIVEEQILVQALNDFLYAQPEQKT